MKKHTFKIDDIPAVIWGEQSENLFIAVHGDQSNKEDEVIQILAGVATSKGYQVLSFDLPAHGERKEETKSCKVQYAVEDLEKIMSYAKQHYKEINIYGCSIGAYFSMVAYKNEDIKQTLFLSPMVEMKQLIENMMMWFDISKERLEKEQEIATPMQTLYWDYYQYVVNHPIVWKKPTSILYGENDEVSQFDYIKEFVEDSNAGLTIVENGEHYFHTNEQLKIYKDWLIKTMK